MQKTVLFVNSGIRLNGSSVSRSTISNTVSGKVNNYAEGNSHINSGIDLGS